MIFRNLDVFGTGIALYQLSIRNPAQAFLELATFTFPLTPTSVRTDNSSNSTFMDTQGPPVKNGVSRIVDTYGDSPPVFLIEGTTGWDRHSADGFALTGLQSMIRLRNFLQQYTQLNQVQMQAGNPNLFALEFYDYFTSQFWQIEPIGPQTIQQSSQRPTLSFYRFRWAAIRPVRQPVENEIDQLAYLLELSAAQSVLNAAQSINQMTLAYGPAGVLVS